MAMNFDDWLLVGGTSPLPVFPVRLRPVVRSVSKPCRYGLLYEDSYECFEECVDEIESFADVDDGNFVPVDPRPLKPAHVLVWFGAGFKPEYMPSCELRQRLEDASAQYLDAAVEWLKVDREMALDRIASACRAAPNDPFPLLARVAFSRALRGDDDYLWLISQSFKQWSPQEVRASFEAAPGKLKPLCDLIVADPIADKFGLKIVCET